MNSVRIKIVDELPSALEFKSLLARSAVNVTTRMHACILSTSAFVPTMSINYLFKLKEYMDSLGMSKYSIDIEDFNAEDSLSMFDELWNTREVEKTILRNVIL